MKRNSFKFAALAIGLLLLATFSSCLDERYDDNYGGGTGKDAMVTFSLQLPAGSQTGEPGTRALTETDENTVKIIDVLVFGKDEKYQYTVTAFSANITNVDARTKKFTVRLKEAEDVTLVVLPNYGLITNGYSTESFKTKSKAEVLGQLKSTVSGKYDVNANSTNYPYIPMWGEVVVPQINEGISLFIPVVRMVSKVDVNVSATTFYLNSVRLYNYNTKGLLVPSTDATNWDETDGKAKRPTVPTDARTLGPLVYDGAEITDNMKSCKGEIYLFEAENHKDANHEAPEDPEKRTCLVIGGKYVPAGTPANYLQHLPVTYYRVDFASKNSNGEYTYLDLLRNHKYNINITKVSGEGFSTPEEAFNSAPVNIEVNIMEWNDGEMSEVIFDGQNFMAVDPGCFTFLKDAITSDLGINQLTIHTDVPAGWKVDMSKIKYAPEGEQWLSLSATSGGTTKQTIWIGATENNSGAERTATIPVAAGRLIYNVKVTQTLTPDIGLYIVDAVNKPITKLVFAAAKDEVPAAQQFTVNWAPRAADLLVSTSNFGSNDAFVFGGTSDVVSNGILSGGTGTKTYTIQPTALTTANLSSNPFLERIMKVEYTVSNGASLENKTLFLQQLVYNTIADEKDNYVVNGSTYSFPVRSNTEWVVSSVSDPNGILSSDIALVGQSGGYNKAPGDNLKFKLVKDTDGSKNGKTATLTLIDPTGKMGTVTVTIKGVSCGMNGDVVMQRIGTKDYATHYYGTGANLRCWMVENLAEGTTSTQFSGSAYGYDWSGADKGTMQAGGTRGSFNGYYYTHDQAASACPDGWRLPTAEEVSTLVSAAGGSNRDTAPEASNISKWWCGSYGTKYGAFSGYYFGFGWYSWGSNGGWWYGTGGQIFYGNTSGMVTDTLTSGCFSLRCVQK